METNNTQTVATNLEAAYIAGVLAGRNIKSGVGTELKGMTAYLMTLTVSFEREVGCLHSQARESIKAMFAEGLSCA